MPSSTAPSKKTPDRKFLTLIRHAKAEPEHPGLKDFDRPLSEDGLEEARAAAAMFAAQRPAVDLILSSSATRALETAQIFADALAYPRRRIAIDEALYLASPDAMLAVLENIDDKMQHIALVGHNPGLSDLARQLSGNRRLTELRTAGVYGAQLPIQSWATIRF